MNTTILENTATPPPAPDPAVPARSDTSGAITISTYENGLEAVKAAIAKNDSAFTTAVLEQLKTFFATRIDRSSGSGSSRNDEKNERKEPDIAGAVRTRRVYGGSRTGAMAPAPAAPAPAYEMPMLSATKPTK
jgi:hypothetical protein